MRHFLGSLLVLVAVLAHASTPPSREGAKIEYLIASIASLQDAKFIRNGVAYDSQAAADHLRLKLHAAGSRVVTAEDFIRVCASVSSVTGSPYRIQFSDGHSVTSEAYLREKLATIAP